MKTLFKGILVVLGVFVLLAIFSDSPEPGALPDVRHLLTSGNGRDWIQLSTREKVRLCVLIEETTGRHDAGDYMLFLSDFYENNSSLNTDIAEAAAVAAALDVQAE